MIILLLAVDLSRGSRGRAGAKYVYEPNIKIKDQPTLPSEDREVVCKTVTCCSADDRAVSAGS